MPVFFSNPLGLWALLGIPLILAIHLLQRHSRRIPTSTLFLLEILERESLKGRRIDRLRSSLSLWLQLLAVVLLAWLLAEPRWPREQSVQRIVLVLDNSASMAAFQSEIGDALDREIGPLVREAGTTEFTVIETSGTGAPLYRGTSLRELATSIADWKPGAGSHPPDDALRVGRGTAGSEGTLVLVTDHPGETLPFGALRLSVGSPIENAGFAGLAFEEKEDGVIWKASIRNHSSASQSREWFLIAGEKRSEARRADLGPGETRIIQGPFPEGVDRLQLVMTPDRFPQDDQMPFVRPRSKGLLVARSSASELSAQLVKSLEASAPSEGETADFWFTTYDPLQPADFPPQAIVFVSQSGAPARLFPGPVVAANHPLMRDLDWQGLLARYSPSIPVDASDQILLWQGERALVILREGGGRRQLIFNFEVEKSNANRVPAFVILIHRFAESIRADKVAPEAKNAELRQALRLAVPDPSEPLEMVRDSESRTIPPAAIRNLRAPSTPGFFSVKQGGERLLESAAHFADVREADFSKAASTSEIGDLPEKIRERQTIDDPLRPLWIALLGSLLLASWWSLADKPAGSSGSAFGAQQEVGTP